MMSLYRCDDDFCKTWKTDSKTLNNPFKILYSVQKEDSFGTHFILLLYLRLGLTECILGTPLSRSSFLLFFPSHHHSRRRDDFIHIDVCLLRARRPTPPCRRRRLRLPAKGAVGVVLLVFLDDAPKESPRGSDVNDF